uniref:BUB1 N-terminal domain-containing protein n=1 Tax=Meloidogyne floridensis TaxID=298350 RepID=A0A915NKP7_9BILA
MSNAKNESFRYVRKMAKTIENDEKRFVFLRSQVNSVEDCMKDGPKKCQTIKSLVIWALKEFIPIENYKSDPRMLDFWYLMGKYSVNMGMESVLERVHRLGYFKNVPEFYLMWADYFGSKQNRESFDKIVQICEENCQLGPSEERFKFLLQKHFESDYYNEGKTLDVIKMLADKSEVVRSDLTLFQRNKFVDTPQNIISDTTIIIAKNQSKLAKNTDKEEKSKLNEVDLLPKTASTSAAIHEEFSVYKDVTYTKSSITVQNTYYPELDDITLAGAHGKFSTDMFTSTPRRSVMPSDFVPLDLTEGTQFFDPPEKEEKVEGGGGLFGCQLTDKAVIKGNEKDCEGLKMKKRLSFADENKRGVSKNTNPMAEAVENRRTSYYPELDDITLAGAHGKFSTDMFTSTPRRSVMPSDFIPLDLTEGDQFFDPTEKEEKVEGGGGLFGCQLKGNEKGGGLNIKKRLSFADENQRGISKNVNPMAEAVERVKKSKSNPNELIKTLPQLKISSPISEGSENFMSFNSPEFPSPFRKKKKDQE